MAQLSSTKIFGDLSVSGQLIINNLNSDTVDNLHANAFLRSDIDSTLNMGKKITLGTYGELVSGTQGPEIKSKSKILIHADTDGTNTNVNLESVQIKSGNGSELGLQVFKTGLKYNNVDVSLSSNTVFTSSFVTINQDLNTLTRSGFHRISSGHSNSPGDWGQIIVCSGGGDTIGQLYFDYNQGNIFTRAGNPPNVSGVGSWTEWRKHLTTSSTKRAGQFHDGTIVPTSTTRLNYDGYLYATRIYNSVYNDYAEYFEKDSINEKFEPGDIIISKKGKYTKSTKANQRNVIGVFSDSYGHILGGKGDGHDDENFIPVGLSGRVNVKIIGKAEEGDLVVSSDIPGVGIVNNDAKLGTIIGKVIQDKDTEKIEKIKIIICLT